MNTTSLSDKPIVIVRWNDAQSSATKVITEHEAGFHAPVVMETLGWLLRDDAVGVSVVCEVFFEEGAYNYRGHTFVPRALIVSVKAVKPARKKREPAP